MKNHAQKILTSENTNINEHRYSPFRYYDPSIGSYISQDPISIQGSLNTYAYVIDPNNQTDIFGLISAGQFGTYANTKNAGSEIGNGVQRHHLNQTGVFGFDRDAGEVIGVNGQASVRGTQHYNAHIHMDDFYESMNSIGKRPTVFRYNVELFKSLRNAGMGVGTSLKGVYRALGEQLRNGVYPWKRIDVNVKRVAHH
ncbi:MAG: hypothetical protein LBV74_04490 [Tannerella sp.]|jgi:RHS repeat-associated protein|nr:hypothetical protein [Tannerella sp.]